MIQNWLLRSLYWLWGMGFSFFSTGISLGSARLICPRLFQKASPGAQQVGGSRAIGLRALWLIDLKS